MTDILADEAWEHLSCPFIHSTNMYWRPALCQTLKEALGIQCRMRQTSSSLQCAGGLVGEERHWAMIIKYDVPVWNPTRTCQENLTWSKLWSQSLPWLSPQTRRKRRSGNPRAFLCSYSSLLCIAPLSIFSYFQLLKIWKRKLTQEPFENVDTWVMCSAEIIRERQVDAKQVRKTKWPI